jgi:parallel beta-helix repeat protein
MICSDAFVCLRIGVWDTNGIPIVNNIIYHTYESGLVVAGKNNIIQRNLVTHIFWSGTAQPQFAEFNTNHDGAIMSKKATSVIMKVKECLHWRSIEVLHFDMSG